MYVFKNERNITYLLKKLCLSSGINVNINININWINNFLLVSLNIADYVKNILPFQRLTFCCF